MSGERIEQYVGQADVDWLLLRYRLEAFLMAIISGEGPT